MPIGNQGGGGSGGGGGYVMYLPAPAASFTLLPYVYQLDASFPPSTEQEGPWYLSTAGTPAFADQEATTGAFGIGKLNDGIVAIGGGGTTAADFLNVNLGNSTGTPRIRVVCDLGSALQPSEIRCYGAIQTAASVVCPNEIKVEFSSDNSSFTTLEDRTGLLGGSGNGIYEARFTPAQARRYWRFSFFAASTNWATCSEIRFLK